MNPEPFRPQWSGVIALVLVPIIIPVFAVLGAARGGHPERGIVPGLGFAAAILVALAVIFLVLGMYLGSMVATVRRERPAATVFATLRTLATSDAVAAFGQTDPVPSYHAVALTPEGVEVWWDNHLRASFRWSEVTQIGTGQAGSRFAWRYSTAPGLFMKVAPASGIPPVDVAFPVIDHRIPIVWRASYANRILDRVMELRAQAPG